MTDHMVAANYRVRLGENGWMVQEDWGGGGLEPRFWVCKTPEEIGEVIRAEHMRSFGGICHANGRREGEE